MGSDGSNGVKAPIQRLKSTEGTERDLLFIFLAVQVIFFHTLSANCHERVFYGDFKFPLFLTMIEFFSNACIAGVKRSLNGTPLFSGFVSDHMVCAIAMLVTHGSSNAALVHLNYTTNTLFKSSKVFFVMMGGWVVHGRRVTILQWGAALLLFMGLAIFGLADRLSSPRFTIIGVCLTLASLLGGSMSGNLQQKAAQRGMDGKSKTERKDDLLFWQYLIGGIMCLFLNAVSGELSQGVGFMRTAGSEHFVNLFAFLASGFAGLNPLLRLVQEYDATSATVVTSVRKVITFTSSFLFFPKPFTLLHAASAGCAMTGAWALQRLRADVEGEQKAKIH